MAASMRPSHHHLLLLALPLSLTSVACTTSVECADEACGTGSDTDDIKGGSSGNGAGTNSNQAAEGVHLDDFCQDACDCIPSVCDLTAQCISDLQDYENQALAAGCNAELASLKSCFDGGVCTNGELDFGPCLGTSQLALDNCIYTPSPPPGW